MKLFAVRASFVVRDSPRHVPSHRYFSSTPFHRLRSSELTESNLSSLRAKSARLWSSIHDTAAYGTGTRYGSDEFSTGLSRLALSKSDKDVRDWFVSTVTSLGCDVQIDKIGNIFATRRGLNNDVPATFVGSHLDSQPNGGRFDGVLGVMAGVEMLRVLDENWIETEGPVGVVNWTNEEGARWKKSMMGSGVWAGKSGLEEVLARTDEEGVSVEEALQGIGYNGETGVGEQRVKMAGHIELHIEQSKVLEREDEKVGIVEGVQGYKWFTVTVNGVEGHAGATGWEDRSDAMHAAAELIMGLMRSGQRHGGLVTVGTMNIPGASVNTIPGKVVLTVDVRHKDQAELEKLVKVLKDLAGGVAGHGKKRGAGLSIDWKEDFASDVVKFDKQAMQCVREGAKNVLGDGKNPRLMTSGAGHDSVYTNFHCPTTMIFVPCRDGLTHNPKEWCSEEDAKVGTDVLIQSVLRFDQLRQKQGDFDAWMLK